MGNNRFKLSDMMPNAWFYKLKDMSKAKKWKHSHAMKNKVSSPTATSQSSKPRYSHYFSISESNRAGKFYSSPTSNKGLDIPFIESPKRSSRRRASRKSIYSLLLQFSPHLPQPTTAVVPRVLALSRIKYYHPV